MSYDYRNMGGIPARNIPYYKKWSGTIVVTPEDIPELLKRNVGNRRVRANVVNQYAQAMKAGIWDWCDADVPLKFGVDGSLMNGQHRLKAQLKAGVTGAYDVRTGVPLESYKNMDASGGRSIADYFAGKKYSNDVSAMSRVIVWAMHGNIKPTGKYDNNLDGAEPSRNDVIEFCESHYEELCEYARMGGLVQGQNASGGRSAYGAALYVIDNTGGDSQAFVDDYVSGESHTAETKQTVLRKLMTRSQWKPDREWYEGITVYSYDAWEDGRGIKVIKNPDVRKAWQKRVLEIQSVYGA